MQFFQNAKFLQPIAEIPCLLHYDSSKKSRVKCDSNHSGLGKCLGPDFEFNVRTRSRLHPDS